jgi:hypothetical protein
MMPWWLGSFWRVLPVVAAAFIALWLGYQAGAYFGERRGHAAGYAKAIADIEEANKQARRKAEAGEDAVVRCYRSGGQWVRQRGACEQPVRGD